MSDGGDSDGTATPPPPVVPRSALKHKEPDWSTPPKFEFSLEVIKNGSVITSLPISDRPFYTVGRQPDVCDILLEHPSISRQHCALQYGEEGELYIIDLGSVHGTFLNKQRLAPNTYTPLFVGSVVKFGESSRLYNVLGPAHLQPPEETSEELEAARQQSERRQERKRREKEERRRRTEKEASGCSWGMADDAVNPEAASGGGGGGGGGQDDAPEERFRMVKSRPKSAVTADEANVHTNDRGLFDQLQKRQAKLENLRGEVERIRAKATTGLSEGQEAQIVKNLERIEQLEVLIAADEDALADREASREAGERRRRRKTGPGGGRMVTMEDDDDDFLDRTKGGRKRRRRGGDGGDGDGGHGAGAAAGDGDQPLTLKSLERRLVDVKYKIKEQRLVVRNAEAAKKAREAEAGSAAGDAEDSLEQYMAQTTGTAQQELLASWKQQLEELEKEKAEVEQLLVLATPAMPGLKPVDPVAEAARRAAAAEAEKNKKKELKQKKKKKDWVPSWAKADAVTAKTDDGSGSGGGAAAAAAAQSAAASKPLTAEEAEAELAAALTRRTTTGPVSGLGAGGGSHLPKQTAAEKLAAQLKAREQRRIAASMKPGLNVRKKE